MGLVYLVGVQPNGQRIWFSGLDNRLDQDKRPIQVPLWDNESGRQVDLSFAIDARERWRSQGLNVQIVLEKYGPPIDEKGLSSTPIERPVEHPSQFVPLRGGGVDGKGYFIHFSPERKKWYCRAIDIPSMIAEHRDRETLWADSPQDVANKIIELWGIKIAVPVDDPEAIEREQFARQQEQAAQKRNQTPRNIRPGDRS
jgi:hypothetical protein